MRWPPLIFLVYATFCAAAGPLTVVIDLNEKFLDVSNEGLWIVKIFFWLSFRQGRRIEYYGDRTKEALFNFVVKSSAPIVENVNAVRLNDIRRDSRNDPAFVIIGEEKNDMQKEFEAVADSLFSKFAWLDGPEMATNIVMGNIEAPNIMVFNYSTYEYYLNDDEPEKMTRASIVTWLDNLAEGIEKGTATALGGRSWPIRIKRMIYELYSNVAQMFTTQPLLSSCLFGVPIAFLSIICYSICSADFSVDREEFYPDDEDEDYDDSLEEDERAQLVDPNHAKNE
ncbi:hypothetical protein ANCCAN_12531 [Ancylostoma caninum]|uniref:Patched family protein n=1 Tax=Ancylostoma caninum TaxID=29170 RepID=A0A368GAQ6_ANCCA|nr:hypothetical protein ANCCAN_12531 [Ancylostoma caninum]